MMTQARKTSAKVSRDADLPPRLVLSNLAAGTVLGKINCTGTKKQVRGQVFTFDNAY